VGVEGPVAGAFVTAVFEVMPGCSVSVDEW
jgi:hypothetical protein